MLQVLTVDIWNQVAEKANGHRMVVAVAFVTDLGKLKMKRGDVLICDASDKNVSAGVVYRDLLAKLHRKGVIIIHHTNLHAKCARFGRGKRYTLVGSSNLSQNSSETLEEVAVVTDDLGVGADVDLQIDAWCGDGIGVEVGESFLKRIMCLPRTKRLGGRKRKTTRKTKRKELGNHIWVVGSCSIDEYSKKEQQIFAGMKDEAEVHRENYHVAQYSPLACLTWSGRCGFLTKVCRGDRIVEIRDKKSVSVEVVLAVKTVNRELYCYKLPMLGMRKRSFKDFNKALGISMRRPVYKEGCARLLEKKHVPLLKKLWSRVDWGTRGA